MYYLVDLRTGEVILEGSIKTIKNALNTADIIANCIVEYEENGMDITRAASAFLENWFYL